MADFVWIGTTNTTFSTATNWLGGAAPVDGSTLTFDGRAIRDCLVSIAPAATAFPSVKIRQGYRFSLGASGTPFAPANGVTDLTVEYGGQGQIWVDEVCTNIHVDMENHGENALNILGTTAGDLTTITIVKGKVVIGAAAFFAASSRVALSGPNAKITIPAGVTYSGALGVVAMDGGTAILNAPQSTIYQTAGTTYLGSDQGTATLTLLEQSGGTFNWESSGTITTARCRGGTFNPNAIGADIAKTLTNGYVYPGANVDLSQSMNLTVTNGWVLYDAAPHWPLGTKVNKV